MSPTCLFVPFGAPAVDDWTHRWTFDAPRPLSETEANATEDFDLPGSEGTLERMAPPARLAEWFGDTELPLPGEGWKPHGQWFGCDGQAGEGADQWLLEYKAYYELQMGQHATSQDGKRQSLAGQIRKYIDDSGQGPVKLMLVSLGFAGDVTKDALWKDDRIGQGWLVALRCVAHDHQLGLLAVAEKVEQGAPLSEELRGPSKEPGNDVQDARRALMKSISERHEELRIAGRNATKSKRGWKVQRVVRAAPKGWTGRIWRQLVTIYVDPCAEGWRVWGERELRNAPRKRPQVERALGLPGPESDAEWSRQLNVDDLRVEAFRDAQTAGLRTRKSWGTCALVPDAATRKELAGRIADWIQPFGIENPEPDEVAKDWLRRATVVD